MRTKIQSRFKAILIAAIIILAASCSDDEVSMPEIQNFRLGYDNATAFHAGDDLHIDAEIVARNGIDVIVIDIHYEGDHKKTFRFADGDHDLHEWEEEIRFEKFRGLKNTTFHEHLDIPADAMPGLYDLHFKVIDQEGYTAEVDVEFTILEPESH